MGEVQKKLIKKVGLPAQSDESPHGRSPMKNHLICLRCGENDKPLRYSNTRTTMKFEDWERELPFKQNPKGLRLDVRLYIYPDGHGNFMAMDEQGREHGNQPVNDLTEAENALRSCGSGELNWARTPRELIVVAVSIRERITKGLELTAAGLRPFVERECKSHLGDNWAARAGLAAWPRQAPFAR